MQRLTVSEAAERLGISEQVVLERVERGTLPHSKQSDGQVYVYLDSEVTGSDSQLTLNYIDKLYTAWQALNVSYRRLTFWTLAVSVLVLALSGGAVSTDENLTISGIGLRVPLAVFMITGAVLIPVFLIAILNLESLGTFYEKEIRSLYKSLGLAKPAMDSPVDPFVTGGIADVLALGYRLQRETPPQGENNHPTGKANLKARGSTLIVIALFVILPTAAQAGAGYKVSELKLLDKEELSWFPAEAFTNYVGKAFAYIGLPRQGSDWVSDMFVVLAFVTAFVLFTSAMGSEREEAGGEVQAETEGSDPGKSSGTSPFTSVFVGIIVALFLGGMAWIGVWLGYIVAAS